MVALFFLGPLMSKLLANTKNDARFSPPQEMRLGGGKCAMLHFPLRCTSLQVIVLSISWYLGMYSYIGGLPSRAISKLLSLDFPSLGEIPGSGVCFISDILWISPH